jgi:hypothetical protein
MAHCRVGGCHDNAIALGLCRRHYDSHRPFESRAGMPSLHLERLEPENIWCECETPAWRSCGPWFPNVRQCQNCGSPDLEQLGRWP